MLGVTSERFPAGGALLLGIMGGIGNISVAITMPILGGIYDAYGAATALRTMAILPFILLLIFGFLWFRDRAKGWLQGGDSDPRRNSAGPNPGPRRLRNLISKR